MLNFNKHRTCNYFILPRALMAVVLSAVCINYTSRTASRVPSRFLKILTQDKLYFNSNRHCIECIFNEENKFLKKKRKIPESRKNVFFFIIDTSVGRNFMSILRIKSYLLIKNPSMFQLKNKEFISFILLSSLRFYSSISRFVVLPNRTSCCTDKV